MLILYHRRRILKAWEWLQILRNSTLKNYTYLIPWTLTVRSIDNIRLNVRIN